MIRIAPFVLSIRISLPHLLPSVHRRSHSFGPFPPDPLLSLIPMRYPRSSSAWGSCLVLIRVRMDGTLSVEEVLPLCSRPPFLTLSSLCKGAGRVSLTVATSITATITPCQRHCCSSTLVHTRLPSGSTNPVHPPDPDVLPQPQHQIPRSTASAVATDHLVGRVALLLTCIWCDFHVHRGRFTQTNCSGLVRFFLFRPTAAVISYPLYGPFAANRLVGGVPLLLT
jgi:hypothetical protein